MEVNAALVGPRPYVLYRIGMGASGLLVTEIFHSLQGETSLAGVPFAFIRLTGCNLRCVYCDSAYAFKGGRNMTEEQILEAIRPFAVKNVLLTGGEPLLQRGTLNLVKRLKASGYSVSIETHGEVSIREFVDDARIIMDIKTPGSGMSRGGFKKNLSFLKIDDEIKFVITSPDDYLWAKELVLSGTLPTREILFSAANVASQMPGTFPGVEQRWLAQRILEDRLAVRLQIQLHKIIWGANERGV